jgi:NAD(P)-dependent dehydrogenase (short-subunit alcohol dehydrogenase family)
VDVRSAEQVEQLVAKLAEAAELPDVFFFNAGINRVDNDESFQLASYKEVLDTNLYGVLNFVQPLTKLPRGEATRHLIAVSSMANYVGNPYGLGYATSKSALTDCFEAWSKMYSGTDLVFQLVMLGPVPTSIYTMADHLPSWMGRIRKVFSGSLDGTVRATTRFALTRNKKLFYPKRAVPLYLGMWLGRSLVPHVFQGRQTLAGQTRRKGS